MTEHFPRNTVSASFWCPKCKRQTQHRIDGGRKSVCLECLAKLEAAVRRAPAAEQEELFA
jgi:hypothetical protein